MPEPGPVQESQKEEDKKEEEEEEKVEEEKSKLSAVSPTDTVSIDGLDGEGEC